MEELNLTDHLRAAWCALTEKLFDADIVLLGGHARIDSLKIERQPNHIYVQLNHHLTRRHTCQPCDWLIARQGSGMKYKLFQTLPKKVRDRVSILSVQISEPQHWNDWLTGLKSESPKIIFPFHERGHVKLNPFHPTMEWCSAYWNGLGTNPFIGMLALKMILLFPVRSVSLVGFDFFQHPSGANRRKLSCHNITMQKQWLKFLYCCDFRINLEPELVKMLGVESRRFMPLQQPDSDGYHLPGSYAR